MPWSARKRDQLVHRLAEPGEHRAGEEDEDRGQEDGLAPVHVAELAVDRRRDRRREQVRGDDPREVVEAAEVADDRRQRGRDDRLVERGQEHAEHQRGEDRANSGHARGGLLDADGGHPGLPRSHAVELRPRERRARAAASRPRRAGRRARCRGSAASDRAQPPRSARHAASRPEHDRHVLGRKSARSVPCACARSIELGEERPHPRVARPRAVGGRAGRSRSRP